MRRLRICILDLVSEKPTKALYARLMNPNLAGIMPQVVGVWCEQAGHEVRLVSYTGSEKLDRELGSGADLVIISAFSTAAQLAYAVSNLCRARGAVTVLGGPHARCYPQDASKYFDYVLGFTDKALILEVLKDCSPHRPEGLRLSASQQPVELPGVRERWKFIEPTLAKAPTIKIVPMIGSLGCPYTCNFCIDSSVDYQVLSLEQMREDLRFLLTRVKRPIVAWHDPNFGVRFDDCMQAIEEAAPPGRIDFIAESSLSLLSEPRLKRLQANGFKALLPGIESWYEVGNKSKTGSSSGMEKVTRAAEHIDLVLKYVPYVQANFVLGLDSDRGDEPFELTKRFIDLSPGTFPGFSLFTAFGQAASLNLELQRAGRVLPFPFHFLNNNSAMNVRPRNYTWPEFYDRVVDLTRYAFSWPRVFKRFRSNRGLIPKWMNVARAVSSEGHGRIHHHARVRRLLDSDASVRRFFEGETAMVPAFYRDWVKRDLGPFWEALPDGALSHDPNAYLESHGQELPVAPEHRARKAPEPATACPAPVAAPS